MSLVCIALPLAAAQMESALLDAVGTSSQIDHHVETRWLQYRQIRGLVAVQYFADICSRLLISVEDAGAVAHQSPDRRELAPLIDRGHRVARGKRNEPVARAIEIRIAADEKRSDPIPKRRECRLDFHGVGGGEYTQLALQRACRGQDVDLL